MEVCEKLESTGCQPALCYSYSWWCVFHVVRMWGPATFVMDSLSRTWAEVWTPWCCGTTRSLTRPCLHCLGLWSVLLYSIQLTCAHFSTCAATVAQYELWRFQSPLSLCHSLSYCMPGCQVVCDAIWNENWSTAPWIILRELCTVILSIYTCDWSQQCVGRPFAM